MSSTATPHLGIPYILTQQSQKEVTANEAFLALDRLINTGAASMDLAAPPVEPQDGELYIVAADASGDWAGHEGEMACWHDAKGWVFVVPNEGMTLWVNDRDAHYCWDGSAWVASGVGGGEGGTASFDGEVETLGVNATADATNRLAVASPAVLFNHEGSDSRVKVNKAASGDTASHLFQTGTSGRAEFGLTGDDDFHLKVSSDGSSWSEAMVVDHTSAQAGFPNCIQADGGISFDGGMHVLGDYETGSWTPAFFGGTVTGTPGYAVRSGTYLRIGQQAVANFYVKLSALGGMSGDLYMGGFPFSIAAGQENGAGNSIGRAYGYSITAGDILGISTFAGGTGIRILRRHNTGTAMLQISQITSSFEIEGQVIYRIA